jgi:hypothetical protein
MITDVPGPTFTIGPSDTGWRLAARLRLRRRRVPMMPSGVLPTAVSPEPFLIDEAGDVEFVESCPDRAALVAGVNSRSAGLVGESRQEVGDRWPSPPRPRN